MTKSNNTHTHIHRNTGEKTVAMNSDLYSSHGNKKSRVNSLCSFIVIYGDNKKKKRREIDVIEWIPIPWTNERARHFNSLHFVFYITQEAKYCCTFVHLYAGHGWLLHWIFSGQVIYFPDVVFLCTFIPFEAEQGDELHHLTKLIVFSKKFLLPDSDSDMIFGIFSTNQCEWGRNFVICWYK